jgi:hypothetical protein
VKINYLIVIIVVGLIGMALFIIGSYANNQIIQALGMCLGLPIIFSGIKGKQIKYERKAQMRKEKKENKVGPDKLIQ